MKHLAVYLILAGLMALPLPAAAQLAGNPERGRTYTAQMCSDCHRTERGQPVKPGPHAPSFTSVAKTKGMSPMALGVWMQTAHPTMPNIMLKPETLDDIIAYIMSLRSAAPAKAP